MAPAPCDLQTFQNQIITYVGGNDSALSWNTLLAMGAAMTAAMQGTLAMESGDPCRISYKKFKLLFILEALEVGIVVASEGVSFVELQTALKERLQWLQWVPPCLLVIGLLELIADLYFTCNLATHSRVRWVPFSSVGWHRSGKNSIFSTLREVFTLSITAGLSLVLVGWRMRWWLVAVAVDRTTAQNALVLSKALSTGAIAFCIAWGLVLSCSLLLLMLYMEISNYKKSIFRKMKWAVNPTAYFKNHPKRNAMDRVPTPELVEKMRHLLYIEYGEAWAHTDDHITNLLRHAPLHVGNAIVSSDKEIVFSEDDDFRFGHLLFLFVEHFTILPLLCCIVAAVAQLHASLDEQAFVALKELVDAVIIVALVELAIGFKYFLWGCGHVGEIHSRDRTGSDPKGGDNEPGLIRRCLSQESVVDS